MEGFMHWRIAPWLRRLITRTLAIMPAVLIIGLRGDSSVNDLLILSQVVLALATSVRHVSAAAFHQFWQKDGPMEKWLVSDDRRLGQRAADHCHGHLRPAGFAQIGVACHHRRIMMQLRMKRQSCIKPFS